MQQKRMNRLLRRDVNDEKVTRNGSDGSKGTVMNKAQW